MLNNLTHALTVFITSIYSHTGLFGILLAMAIESCCIPLPSEIVMPLAGVMIANHTILAGMPLWASLLLVALAGSIGCVIGSSAAYGIGYKGGRPLMLKYGRYVLISQHDADKADQFFQRWGNATAFFSRLLPVVRTYISLPAGISKMPFKRFCLYTFLGSFPWCLLLAYIGTLIGGNVEKLANIFHGADIFILIAIVVLVVLYVWRHIRNDRMARTAHEVEASAVGNGPAVVNNAPANWNQQAPQQPQWNQQAQMAGNRAPVPPQSQQAGGPPPQQWQQQAGGPPPQQWQQQPPQAPRGPQQQGPAQNWPPQQDDDRTIYRR